MASGVAHDLDYIIDAARKCSTGKKHTDLRRKYRPDEVRDYVFLLHESRYYLMSFPDSAVMGDIASCDIYEIAKDGNALSPVEIGSFLVKTSLEVVDVLSDPPFSTVTIRDATKPMVPESVQWEWEWNWSRGMMSSEQQPRHDQADRGGAIIDQGQSSFYNMMLHTALAVMQNLETRVLEVETFLRQSSMQAGSQLHRSMSCPPPMYYNGSSVSWGSHLPCSAPHHHLAVEGSGTFVQPPNAHHQGQGESQLSEGFPGAPVDNHQQPPHGITLPRAGDNVYGGVPLPCTAPLRHDVPVQGLGYCVQPEDIHDQPQVESQTSEGCSMHPAGPDIGAAFASPGSPTDCIYAGGPPFSGGPHRNECDNAMLLEGLELLMQQEGDEGTEGGP